MKNDSLSRFVSETAYPRISRELLKMNVDFHEQKDSLKYKYLDSLKKILKKLQEFNMNTKKEAAFLSLSILRSNILYGKETIDAHIYDKDWYANNYVKVGEIDASDFFKPLGEIRTYLSRESKKFVGKINNADVEYIVAQSIKPFSNFFIRMIRYILAEITECKEYRDIEKANNFMIYAGELYDKIYTLYRESKYGIDYKELEEKIASNEPCLNYDLRNGDFENKNMSYSDLSYSDFRSSCLKSTNLSNSILEGVIFKDCDMKGAVLRDSNINEVNFQNADLRGVPKTSEIC